MSPRSYALLFAVLLLGVAFADTTLIDVPISTSSELVAVNSSIHFADILPGYEYRGVITVSWNAPENAVSSITASEVPVYVLISAADGSPILFKQDGELASEARLILTCKVENKTCSSGSDLTHTVEVLVLASDGFNASVPITVNASLKPLWGSDAAEKTMEQESASAGSSASSDSLGKASSQSSSGTSKAGLLENKFDLAGEINKNIVPLAALLLITIIISGAYLARKGK